MEMEVDTVNSEGKVTGKTKLPIPGNGDKAIRVNAGLIHEVVRAYLANQRKGTHDTLTRSEVQGSGKKPWKQKHTGRARAGTSTSPLWKGGGIIFGPHPRSYRIDLPHSKIRSALSQVLAAKASNGQVIISEKVQLEKPRTKTVSQWLRKLSLPENTLLVLDKKDESLFLASRNIPGFNVTLTKHLHPYDALQAKKIVFTPEAAQCL